MKQLKNYVFFIALLTGIAFSFTSFAKTINGVELYEAGHFPHGKMLSMSDLTNLPNGTWEGKVYLIEPVEFKGSGTPDGRGGYIYTAKINHTWVGGLFVSVTDSSAANSVLRVKIPYNTPIHNGTVYKFTSAQPLTVISKKSQLDSNGKNFSIYDCIFQGYMIINNSRYPVNN